MGAYAPRLLGFAESSWRACEARGIKVWARAGAVVAVPYARAGNDLCAVRTLRAYLEAAGVHRGPVFRRAAPRRHPHRPAALRPVGRADRQAPRPHRPASPSPSSPANSLRAGYATAAAAAGAEKRKIANVTRHKNPVLRRYIPHRHGVRRRRRRALDPKPTQGLGSPPLVRRPRRWVGGPSRAAQRRARGRPDYPLHARPQAGSVIFRTPLHGLWSVCRSSAEGREHLGCLGSYARRDDLTCVPVRDDEVEIGRAAGDVPERGACWGWPMRSGARFLPDARELGRVDLLDNGTESPDDRALSQPARPL
jgi:hypothetical protein